MWLPKPIRQLWRFSSHIGNAIWLWSIGGGAVIAAFTWIADQPLWLVAFVALSTSTIILILAQRLQRVFRSKSESRLRQRARGLANTLRGRLLLAESARNGNRSTQIKWKKKASSQILFRTDRFEAADDGNLSEDLAMHFEKALGLIAELEKIATLTADNDGYVTLAQAAGRYVVCGNKLYIELATISGINPDWKTST